MTVAIVDIVTQNGLQPPAPVNPLPTIDIDSITGKYIVKVNGIGGPTSGFTDANVFLYWSEEGSDRILDTATNLTFAPGTELRLIAHYYCGL